MKKKVSSIFKFTILTLLFLFITIYLSDRNGYYAYSNYKKSILTEDAIDRFEKDVATGKAIDVENYIEKEKDYSNNISKTSLEISDKVGYYIRKGIVNFFDKVTKNIE